MDLGKEVLELRRNLYLPIEPYSSGLLKVSDLHSIYWEQSGNPNGHVSGHFSILIIYQAYFFVYFYFYLICSLI